MRKTSCLRNFTHWNLEGLLSLTWRQDKNSSASRKPVISAAHKTDISSFLSIAQFVKYVHARTIQQLNVFGSQGKTLTAGPARLLSLRKTMPRTLTQYHKWAVVPDRVWLPTAHWMPHNAYTGRKTRILCAEYECIRERKKRHRPLNIPNAF